MFYFYKMQGTGNDFVIIDYTKNKFQYSFRLLAQFFCDRHYGVGADGLLVVCESKVADFKMRIFNSDGSEAEMCGNGIRCFAKYLYEHRKTQKESFTIETLGGIREISLKIEGSTVVSIKVNMGEPNFDFEKIPVIYSDTKTEDGIIIEGLTVFLISIGNPHAVCFVENINNIPIDKIGKAIENYKYFPNKINVEFVQILDENRIRVRVWERGVGETLSCGTGACAAAIFSNLKKQTNSKLLVELKGGTLKIDYDKNNKCVMLEGIAENVFEGIIDI